MKDLADMSLFELAEDFHRFRTHRYRDEFKAWVAKINSGPSKCDPLGVCNDPAERIWSARWDEQDRANAERAESWRDRMWAVRGPTMVRLRRFNDDVGTWECVPRGDRGMPVRNAIVMLPHHPEQDLPFMRVRNRINWPAYDHRAAVRIKPKTEMAPHPHQVDPLGRPYRQVNYFYDRPRKPLPKGGY